MCWSLGRLGRGRRGRVVLVFLLVVLSGSPTHMERAEERYCTFFFLLENSLYLLF
jgi:hypothetical protein